MENNSMFNFGDPSRTAFDRFSPDLTMPNGNLQQMIVQTGANAGALYGRGMGGLLGIGNEAAHREEQRVFQRLAQESRVDGDPVASLVGFSNNLAQRGFYKEAEAARQQAMTLAQSGDKLKAMDKARQEALDVEQENATVGESLANVGDMSAMTEDQMAVIKINAIKDPKKRAEALFEYNQQAKVKTQEQKVRQGALNQLKRAGIKEEDAIAFLDADPKNAQAVLSKAITGRLTTQEEVARKMAVGRVGGGGSGGVGKSKAETAQDVKEQGELTAELKSHEDTLANIKAAKDIFTAGEATGSGAGALLDAGARFFGMTTEGMKASRQLKVLSGRLALSVPRFSGPQSDKDVALYRETVADVGNEELTLKERQAALLKAEEMVLQAQQRARDRQGYVPVDTDNESAAEAARLRAKAAGGRRPLSSF